jgi:hypothetical protein
MTQPDLKTLITGFLILAVITSSVAFIFSGIGQSGATGSAGIAGVVGQADEEVQNRVAQISKNAFVEPLPNDLPFPPQQEGFAAENAPTSSIITPSASDNLTENFINIAANQILENNPEGPRTDENGNQLLNLPTEDYAARMIVESLGAAKFKLEESISDKDIKTATTYTKDDLVNYLDSIDAVISKNAASPEFEQLLGKEPSTEAINASQLVLSETVRGLAAISVPQPFVKFHKTLLGFFANQKTIFETAADYERDPLKTLIVLQDADKIIDRDLNALQNEFQKTDIQKIISGQKERGGLISFVRGIVSIREAHAQWVVHDPVTMWTRVAEWIKDSIKDIAKSLYITILRTLVNKLINQIQKQVVNWIAGGGKPKFVTNWKNLLSDAFSQAAGTAIQRMMPGMCSSFGPLLQIALRPIPDIYDYTSCTLGDIERNITNFYNDFKNGGWVAYGSSLQPRNNFFGSLIEGSDIALREGARAQEAARNEAQSSQGFTGVKRCTKTDPSGFEGAAGLNKVGDIIERGGGNGKISALVECVQDETITPGSTVAGALHISLGWKASQIVSAQRLEELFAAIIDASVNRVIGLGLKFATQAMAGGAPSSGGQVYSDLETAYSATSTVSGSEETPGGGKTDLGDAKTIREQAETILSLLNQTVSSNNKWVNRQPTVISLLNDVAAACPNRASEAQSRIQELTSASSTVTAETIDALGKIGDLLTLLDQITNADPNDAEMLLGLTRQMDRYDFTAINEAANTASGRLGDLQNLETKASANLANEPPDCATPL